jgi:hypothetical protein
LIHDLLVGSRFLSLTVLLLELTGAVVELKQPLNFWNPHSD